MNPKLHAKPEFTRRGFLWITLLLFAGAVLGHWTVGWFEYVDEQQMHGQPVEAGQFAVQMLRGTLENWQAEFMGIAWQIFGLALFYAVGSPQSREGDERKEKKLDLILKKLDPQNAETEIAKLDRDYGRT
jgi:hypothetical protein